MGYRTCESCGEGFHQYGRGRPAKRCPDCRGGDRYGAVHRAVRATSAQAVGQLCTRCGQQLLEGQPVEPDHADGGGPHDYAGWAHASCNHSAGAARGNRLRAQAYRALQGAVVGREVSLSGSAASNGTPAPAPAVKPRDPRLDNPLCVRTRELINANEAPMECLCGRKSSRCW
jgi:hypothetical protein